MNATSNRYRKILLVDDDRLIRLLLSEVLRRAGHEIIEANCAEEALKIVYESEPDLALLDVTMPGMSGIELAKILREKTSVAFMFLSAHDDIEIIRQATEYGAVGYLVKPVDVSQIIPAVEAALAGADEIKRLRRTEINLNAALAAGRETSMAVGLLMARYQTDRNVAFETLRDYARSQRRKLNDVAQELLAAEETLNSFRIPIWERSSSR